MPDEAVIDTVANRMKKRVAEGRWKLRHLDAIEQVCLDMLETSTSPIQKAALMAWMESVKTARG